ncbi:MAG TPA: carboxypeptidase regulatory-like domain-containing protein [Bryobacteraceae bacterium]|nr:carboxypeptidase regulatory-like domain-containing protein [Bryobacteraceae bacterium]
MRRAAFLLFAAIPFFAQPQTGTIHGVVKDSATGQPLADFNITCVPIDGPPKIPPNALVIISHKAGSDTAKRIAIDPDTGNTISETEIPHDQTAYTAGDGKYILTNVPAGALTITARNPRRDTATKEITLAPGDDAAVDFLIPPSPSASGRVLDPDKKPASGVEVWAVLPASADGATHYSLFGPQLTDDNGVFRFDWGLTAGKKFYLIAKRSRNPKTDPEKPIEVPTYYGDAIALEAASPIVLERGENRGSLDIQLRRSAHYCVAGTLAVSGRPARNRFEVRELALAETLMARASGASDDHGNYRVCGLTPGQYRIMGNASGGEAGMEDFTVTDSDVSHIDLALDAVPLHLTVEWDGDPVTPPLPSPGLQAKLAAMGVNIDRPSVRYQSSVQVLLNGLSSRENATVDPPFDGLFDSHLPVGDYRVTVHAPACCYIKEVDYGGVRLSGPLHLGVGSSGTLRVLIGTDGATLRCHATDDDGKPVENAVIVLIPAVADGEPQLHWNVLAPGKYRVMAVNRNVTLAEDLDKIRAALGNAQSIELAPKAKLELSLKALSID